jgi:hypothetical protein
MTESKIDSFNIEPLVFEIENVIKNGLKVILKDYIVRHDLLEKTHKQIMKLPSVMNEINKGCESDSDSDIEAGEDKSMFVSITDMTRDLVKKEMAYVETKLDRIEKKYESISPLISRILDKLESINDEVKVLKETPRDNIKIVQMDHEKSYISNIIKPSIVSACENENIKFEIDENDDDEEEFVEPVKVKKEEIVVKEEELEEEELEEEELEEEEVEEEEVEEEEVETAVVADIKEESEAEEEVEQEDVVEAEEEVEQEDVVEEESEAEEEDVVDDEVETEASEEEDEEEEESEPTPATKVDVEEEEEEEAELEIFTIDDIDYCTDDLENGFIWELSEDGEQGDKIGYLKEGEPFFYADEN